MLNISSYDPKTLCHWKAIKGYPQQDDRPFAKAFGFPLLEWMHDGRVWQNSHGGSQNLFYLCHVRSVTKGMAAQLYAWCEKHGFWFTIEGKSIYKPDDHLAVFVAPFATEFEYA